MSDKRIPSEAVEAAAKVMRANEGYDWDNMGVHPNVEVVLKETFRAQARLILEAAAPYMLATNRPEKEVSTGTLIRKLLDEARADG